jgi:hypothetical protein
MADFDHKLTSSRSLESLDYEENGLYEDTLNLLVPPPVVHTHWRWTTLFTNHTRFSVSPLHEGITPFSNVPELTLSWPAGYRPTDASKLDTSAKKPDPPKKQVSRWILFVLWFNTYRKFFVLIVALNLTGIVMTALGWWHYAEDHLGALVLGNLLCAILMRNELFLRFLYLLAIYGLRSVCTSVRR